MDVVRFERRLADGTPAALAEPVTLYEGDLLQGLARRRLPMIYAQREFVIGTRRPGEGRPEPGFRLPSLVVGTSSLLLVVVFRPRIAR